METSNGLKLLVGDQMISKEELDRLGLPKDSLKIKHPKTGAEGYRAAIEVFHQLHCLNLIRQAVYRDYYKDLTGDVGEAESEADLTGHVGKHSIHLYIYNSQQRTGNSLANLGY
jgi:Mycotoxin biosynthesis protein UstYa